MGFLEISCGHSFAQTNVYMPRSMHTSVAMFNIYMHTHCAQPGAHSGALLPFWHFQYIPRKTFPALRLPLLSPHHFSSSLEGGLVQFQ